MDKQDYLDFITTVCNVCVNKGHNRYAGDICEMSTDNIDYCADRVGYKPISKFKIYLVCGVCGSTDISYEKITLTSGTELELHVVCEDCRTTTRLSPPMD